MKTTLDLVISILLLMTYSISCLYARALLQRAASRNGQPHYATAVISLGKLRKLGLTHFSRFDPDKEKARALLRLGRFSLYILIIFVISSLLFESKSKKPQGLFYTTTNSRSHGSR